MVILKLDALSFDETNKAFVYEMDDAGEMKEVFVETGVSNGNYVEIKSGLKANDTVYVKAKATETTSSIASMFSSLFGGQRVNNRNSFRNNNNNNNNRQNFGGGSGSGSGMPSMPGGNGGGNR